jgi:hypothetical protein
LGQSTFTHAAGAVAVIEAAAAAVITQPYEAESHMSGGHAAKSWAVDRLMHRGLCVM